MLQNILVPVSIVTGAGLIAGLLLSIASKFFAVEVDETVAKLREVLPGANCGACGCAGCDEYAAKMAAGDAEPNLCPVGGAAVAAQLGEILGVSVGSIEPKRAVVRCRGHLQTSEYIMDYDGPKTCQAAKLLYNGRTSCNYACLGYGDCVNANTTLCRLLTTSLPSARICASAVALVQRFARTRFWTSCQEARPPMSPA